MAHTERAGTGAGVGVGAATDTTDCSLCGWWFPRAQEDTLADLQACLETEYGMIAAVLRDRLSTAASSWALPFSTVHCAATLSNIVADNCLRADLVDAIKNGEVQLLVNTPSPKTSHEEDSFIRKAAIKHKIPYITTAEAALAAAKGIAERTKGKGKVKSLQAYHKDIR